MLFLCEKMKKKIYLISVVETLQRIIEVRSIDEEQAIKKVQKQYKKSKIVLDESDFGTLEIKPYKR